MAAVEFFRDKAEKSRRIFRGGFLANWKKFAHLRFVWENILRSLDYNVLWVSGGRFYIMHELCSVCARGCFESGLVSGFCIYKVIRVDILKFCVFNFNVRMILL